MFSDKVPFLHAFQTDVSTYPQPAAFTFPFSYEPHPLSIRAAEELQHYLENQHDFIHNFGLTAMDGPVIGKMFGVLVVETADGQLGYLAAYSGKLANSNQHRFFVPPIFDMLRSGSFFLQEEEQINAINREIATLTADPEIAALQARLAHLKQEADDALKAFRAHMKQEKNGRKEKRTLYKEQLSEGDYKLLEEDLIKQSYRDQHAYDVLKQGWNTKLTALTATLQTKQDAIEQLKTQRKEKSAALQRQLFDQYQFLNARGATRSVLSIFEQTTQQVPPAGAGECAAPKLLQYAFAHGLKPVCMAEFWWGASPASEVRKHQYFYPACKSKCEPILSHMLIGLNVDPNPMLENPAEGKKIEIIYDDEAIVVINKPAEFLSVPGIHIQDSVYTRILEMYPEITGPVIIHRLDMSTSGILIIAKHKAAHQFIQDQFIQHTIKKRYTAMLEGELQLAEGLIDLPLRVDLDDRPRQIVCATYGKPAQTKFKRIALENGRTRVHFFPLTGRTHQLRVHAAHKQGLNLPIVGDDLYGIRDERLHLHAGYIQFTHPTSKEVVTFTVADPF